MKFYTIFICIFAAAFLGPVSTVPIHHQEISNQFAIQNGPRASILPYFWFPKDWLSDLIKLILGVEVSELLHQINATLEGLHVLINSGIEILLSILESDSVSQPIKDEIMALIDQALERSLETIKPILDDLGLVLPAINLFEANSNNGERSSAADIIEAILGVSLEEFLTTVTRALDQLDVLILETLTELTDIAKQVSPEIAEEIREASDEHLIEARAVMKPLLDGLHQVLPPSLKLMARTNTATKGVTTDYVTGLVDKFFRRFSTQMNQFVVKHNLRPQEARDIDELMTQVFKNIKAAVLQLERQDRAETLKIMAIIKETTPKLEKIVKPYGRKGDQEMHGLTNKLYLSVQALLELLFE